MTSGNPGRNTLGARGVTAPIVRISVSALTRNVRAVTSQDAECVLDIRADAWGHGVRIVGPAAIRAGAHSLLVDDTGAHDLGGLIDPTRLVRVGQAPASDAVYGLRAGFTPVMSMHGRVLSLKLLRAGEGVSYGYTHRAQTDTTIALVTGGYGQGIARSLGNAASVRVAGERHPIIGRVAMDACVVDIGVDAQVQRGDEVVFFGDPASGSPALGEWSEATGMTAAELATVAGLHNAREYAA